MKSVTVDTSGLDRAIVRYSAAMKKTLKDSVLWAGRQFAQHAQKETILQAGRGTRPRASKPSEAQRTQLARLDTWTNTLGRKRRGYGERPPKNRYLRKSIRAHYFRVIKKRQGELAAGWNAAIAVTGGKYAPKTKRHGTVHGKAHIQEKKTATTLKIRFVAQKGTSLIASIASFALKRASHGMKQAAKNAFRRNKKRA